MFIEVTIGNQWALIVKSMTVNQKLIMFAMRNHVLVAAGKVVESQYVSLMQKFNQTRENTKASIVRVNLVNQNGKGHNGFPAVLFSSPLCLSLCFLLYSPMINLNIILTLNRTNQPPSTTPTKRLIRIKSQLFPISSMYQRPTTSPHIPITNTNQRPLMVRQVISLRTILVHLNGRRELLETIEKKIL